MKNKKETFHEEVVHNFNEANEHGKEIRAHDIEPLDIQKRLRTLGGWLLDAVFEEINIFNHITRMRAYLKQIKRMRESYPIYDELGHLDEINIEAWARYQKVYKEEIKPALVKYKKQQIKKDLRRMGFL